MADVSVDIKNNSDDFKKKFRTALENALEGCGIVAEDYAKHLVPVAPEHGGTLRDSIDHKVVPQEKSVYIGTNERYARYVEEGTGIYYEGGRKTPWAWQDDDGNWHRTNGMKPRSYLKPAVTKHKNDYFKIFEMEFDKIKH